MCRKRWVMGEQLLSPPFPVLLQVFNRLSKWIGWIGFPALAL